MLLMALVSGFVIYALSIQLPVSDPLFFWLGLASLVVMVLIVIISFYISFFVVSRVNHITTIAQQIIETGDLHQRITISGKWDDLSKLAQVLNGFLARMEMMLQNIRDVTDNIAHDLRTPLARLRNQLETMSASSQNEASRRALSEADQILATFNALLRIANIEKAKRYQHHLNFSLGAMLEDVLELYEPACDEKNITLNKDLLPCKYSGDRDMLFQVFVNLMDNALKFTPSGGTITLTLKLIKGRPIITLTDSGVGIPAQAREKVFQRFYRADTAHHHTGHGLGLSLVRAALDLHKADIVLQDNAPGLKVIITL
jgi:signal transduction histidine kinase